MRSLLYGVLLGAAALVLSAYLGLRAQEASSKMNDNPVLQAGAPGAASASKMNDNPVLQAGAPGAVSASKAQDAPVLQYGTPGSIVISKAYTLIVLQGPGTPPANGLLLHNFP